MPKNPNRNPHEKQVPAWRTATIIPSIANSETQPTKVEVVREGFTRQHLCRKWTTKTLGGRLGSLS